MPHNPSPENLIRNWEHDYEIRHQEVVLEVDTLHQAVKQRLEQLGGDFAVTREWFANFVEENPWQHFGYDQAYSYTKIGATQNKNEIRKLHARPVPLTDEMGRINTNLYIQPYATAEYDTYIRKYSRHGFRKVGWQVIERPKISELSGSGEEPVIIDSNNLVSPQQRFIDHINDQPYLKLRNNHDMRHRPVRPLFEESRFVVLDETSDQRLGFLAALRSFESVHFPAIEQDMQKHVAVKELIERGVKALDDLDMSKNVLSESA